MQLDCPGRIGPRCNISNRALCRRHVGRRQGHEHLPVAIMLGKRGSEALVLLGGPGLLRRGGLQPPVALQALAGVPPGAQLPSNRRPLNPARVAGETRYVIPPYTPLAICHQLITSSVASHSRYVTSDVTDDLRCLNLLRKDGIQDGGELLTSQFP